MTNEELKGALMHESPVIWRSPIYGTLRYKCINAVRYTRGAKDTINISAELLDYNTHSITVVNAEEVFFDK